MPLSNTATPKYYGEFRQKVINGEIPVCENISLEMNRIDRLIRDPKFFYDPAPVEGWIRFCEHELTLTDGSPMHVLPSFRLWVEQVYGWYYFIRKSVYVQNKDRPGGHYENRTVKRRLTTKQFIIVGRGGAKTIYAGDHQAYGLTVDKSTTKGVVTAPTMKQAEETTSPIATAITRSRGPYFKFLTFGSQNNTKGNKLLRPKLYPSKKGIENSLTNSLIEIRPMSIDKLQGLRNKYSTVDEWLSCDIREDPIGALEQGASKIDDYLIIATSSEGTVRNGAGDTIKLELKSILKGDYYAPNVSIFWYCLDNIKEVANPNLWIKANPNIGQTVSFETYQQEVERAEHSPSARNDTLAKRFGIATEGYTYYFTYEETKPHKKRSFWNMPCSMGSDLSQGDDFCAFTFLFPLKDDYFGVKTRSYITERTLQKLQPAMRNKYSDFIDEGTLIVMPGTVLDMMKVYDDLDEFIIENNYNVLCHGYDPYNAKEFIERWITENGDYGVEKVIQGRKTESVPLGELKKLSEDSKLLFDEALMSFAIANCIVLEDVNGNRMLYKRRREEKIDNVAAMLDAYVAYKLNVQSFN